MAVEPRGGLDWVPEARDRLRREGLLRSEKVVEGCGVEVLVDGSPAVSFSSNDYLGLAGHPAVVTAFHVEHQTGSTGSRLISGTTEIHRRLEERLAVFHGYPEAVLFPSGYHLNSGLIPVLVGRGDTVVSDALNHASLIDGCRLSRAEIRTFAHQDPVEANQQLQSGAGRKLLVTESLFSMDGDRSPLRELATIARRQGAALMVDEAHAVGIVGDGRGCCHDDGIRPDILVGMMGKAFGLAGAYLCASKELCDLVRSRARSYMFSTASPVGVVAAGLKSLAIIDSSEGNELRETLWKNCGYFSAHILSSVRGPIFPVIVGGNRQAVHVAEELLQKGYWVQAVRPPTVPENSARLRIVITAKHTPAQLVTLAGLLRDQRLI